MDPGFSKIILDSGGLDAPSVAITHCLLQGSSVPSFSNKQIKKGFTRTAHCDNNDISFLISRFRKNPVWPELHAVTKLASSIAHPKYVVLFGRIAYEGASKAAMTKMNITSFILHISSTSSADNDDEGRRT